MWFRFLAVLGNSPTSIAVPVAFTNRPVLRPISELLAFLLLYSVQGTRGVHPFSPQLTSTVVLQIRVHVMYMSVRLAAFNVLLFAAEIALMVVLWARAVPFATCTVLGVRLPQSSCSASYPLFYLPGAPLPVQQSVALTSVSQRWYSSCGLVVWHSRSLSGERKDSLPTGSRDLTSLTSSFATGAFCVFRATCSLTSLIVPYTTYCALLRVSHVPRD